VVDPTVLSLRRKACTTSPLDSTSNTAVSTASAGICFLNTDPTGPDRVLAFTVSDSVVSNFSRTSTRPAAHAGEVQQLLDVEFAAVPRQLERLQAHVRPDAVAELEAVAAALLFPSLFRLIKVCSGAECSRRIKMKDDLGGA
jgi:hypothetical protein